MTNKPKKVILHCSATPDYEDSSERYDLFGALDIDAWHRQRGFREIGYHYVVRRTGVIEVGDRDWTEYGAHVQGHNTDTLGVCYIGTRRPSLKQVQGILDVFTHIHEKFGILPDQWFGHYEFTSKKECPGISMMIVRKLLEMELKSPDKRTPTIKTIRR